MGEQSRLYTGTLCLPGGVEAALCSAGAALAEITFGNRSTAKAGIPNLRSASVPKALQIRIDARVLLHRGVDLNGRVNALPRRFDITQARFVACEIVMEDT